MQACAAGYALTYLSTLNEQVVTWRVVGLTAPKFKPLMRPMHGFSLSSCIYILSHCSDYRRGMDWLLDLLTTCIHHSELHFTDDWHSQTSVLSVLQSPLAVPWQRLLPGVILQLSALRPDLGHKRSYGTILTPSFWRKSKLENYTCRYIIMSGVRLLSHFHLKYRQPSALVAKCIDTSC
jgi:hypothetical protein